MIIEREYNITEDMCKDNVIKYHNLFRLMLNTSDEHSKIAQATTEDLLRRGYTWMIYKWRVDFYKMPVLGEKIKIKTWASEFKRLNACREFSVYNEKNEKIISASTIFLIVDMNKKKPIRIPDFVAEKFGIHEEKNFENIKRIKIKGEEFSSKDIEIKDENIDINNHVNNLVYLDWIIESMPSKYIEENKLEKISLIYNREIVNSKKVNITNYKEDRIYTEIKTNEINAMAESIWKIKA